MIQNCFRCNDPIDEPTENHAAYVISEDTTVTEPVEVADAVVHTQETKDALSKLQEHHYPDASLDELEHAVASDAELTEYLGPPTVESDGSQTHASNAKETSPKLVDFDREEIRDVADAPSDTVKVERKVKQKSVQKTGLVCLDCKKDDDTIIWDAEDAE